MSARPTPFPAPLEAFVELFDQEAFWASHEVLEGSWRETDSDFYHGLILYTSAFVHVRRGNRSQGSTRTRPTNRQACGPPGGTS